MKSGFLLFIAFGDFSSMQLLALVKGDVEKVNAILMNLSKLLF